MKLSKLIYKKRKINIIGLILFIVLAICKYEILILRFSITTFIKLMIKIYKWSKSYYLFYKSGYSYYDIDKIIKNMTGREFEIFMSLLFKELGYKVKLTPANNDGGKDIILKDKNNNYIYVECKRWIDSWKVGRPELQKLVGSAYGDCIEQMIFVTTGDYTKEAIEYSIKIDNLKLWDITHVMKNIMKINKNKIPYMLNKSLAVDNTIVKLNSNY